VAFWYNTGAMPSGTYVTWLNAFWLHLVLRILTTIWLSAVAFVQIKQCEVLHCANAWICTKMSRPKNISDRICSIIVKQFSPYGILTPHEIISRIWNWRTQPVFIVDSALSCRDLLIREVPFRSRLQIKATYRHEHIKYLRSQYLYLAPIICRQWKQPSYDRTEKQVRQSQ